METSFGIYLRRRLRVGFIGCQRISSLDPCIISVKSLDLAGVELEARGAAGPPEHHTIIRLSSDVRRRETTSNGLSWPRCCMTMAGAVSAVAEESAAARHGGGLTRAMRPRNEATRERDVYRYVTYSASEVAELHTNVAY